MYFSVFKRKSMKLGTLLCEVLLPLPSIAVPQFCDDVVFLCYIIVENLGGQGQPYYVLLGFSAQRISNPTVTTVLLGQFSS